MSRHVCFVTYREALGPIFSSVYLTPAEHLVRLGHDVSVLSYSSLGEFAKPALRRRFNQLRADAKQRSGCRLWRVPTRSRAWEANAWDRLVTHTLARWSSSMPSRGVLHAGGARATDLATRIRRIRTETKVVYHVWGPEAAEHLFAASGAGHDPATATERAALLHEAQARAAREADLVVCVSEAMKQWAQTAFGVPAAKLMVVPCFCDAVRAATEADDRERMRRELGYSDSDVVVVYSGSMLAWQLSVKALQILGSLADLGAPVRFLGLTMHTASLRRRLDEVRFPGERLKILSVPHREVTRYLAAADLGILGRNLFEQTNLVNQVSSPIKFGEYLAAGTPVVLAEDIGDFSEATRAHRLGVVIPGASTKETLAGLLRDHVQEYRDDRAAVRARCQRFATTHLDVRRWVGELASAYRVLCPN